MLIMITIRYKKNLMYSSQQHKRIHIIRDMKKIFSKKRLLFFSRFLFYIILINVRHISTINQNETKYMKEGEKHILSSSNNN
jgi:hypothetical protein